MVEIVPMTEVDLEEKARVHVRCWRETYAALVPEAWLRENVTFERMLERQRRRGVERVLLAREAGSLVGFVSWEDEARPWAGRTGVSELSSLYLLRSHQGRGIGRALTQAALGRCPHDRTVLLVLEGNERALGFYEHLGFSATDRLVTDGPLTELEMLRQTRA